MSPVVRVRPRAVEGQTPPAPPVRHRLDLSELLRAAQAADVLLPVDDEPSAMDDRFAERLDGTSTGEGSERVVAARQRALDEGPDGAAAALRGRGLMDEAGLSPLLEAGLRVLAGSPVSAVLDLAVARSGGTHRLRSWLGVAPSLATQLSTTDGLDYELACFDPRHWVSQVARAATVTPWVPEPAPLVLPDRVSLPSELLAGALAAHREHRDDLLPVLAEANLGRVRTGRGRRSRAAGSEEVLALLRTLGGGYRGRLRLLVGRRGSDAKPAVASWVLLDDGWRELRPGRQATTVLRRREPRDLGLLTLPMVRPVTEEGGR